MPINYAAYPYNWDDIRADILCRADNCCEFCGVENYSVGYRKDGEFKNILPLFNLSPFVIKRINEGLALDIGARIIKIILTIAHLDQNPMNNDYTNLRALCQRCHLNYDRDMRLKKEKGISLYE